MQRGEWMYTSFQPTFPLAFCPLLCIGNGAFIYSCHTHCASQGSAYNKFAVRLHLETQCKKCTCHRPSLCSVVFFYPISISMLLCSVLGWWHDDPAGRIQVVELGQPDAVYGMSVAEAVVTLAETSPRERRG